MSETVLSQAAPASSDGGEEWARLCDALLDVACTRFDALEPALERVMEAAASALDVGRVGLWLYADGGASIACEALWTPQEGLRHPDLSADRAAFPAYFAALHSELVIDACDARNDPRTREFDQAYLQPHGVGAMLDVPVRRCGEAVGVLCLEHLGGPRQWSPGERMFSAALAIAVSQLLEHARFRDAVESRDRAIFYDSLTGLPNRALFLDRLAQSAAGSGRNRVALVVADIDRFVEFHRAAGVVEADRLLCSIAERLAGLVAADAIGRVGGDEFAFIVQSPAPAVAALSLASRIRSALAAPLSLGKRSLTVSASIGIVADVGSCARPEDALRDAQIACGEALRVNRGGQRFFEEGMQSEARSRFELEVSIRDAAARGEFGFFLQPIVSAEDGRVVGAEALLRWMHPQRGVVPPAEFLAIAEASGLLAEIHRPLVRSLLPRVADWRSRPGLEQFRLSINFDLRQLSDPGFAEHTKVVLAEAGLPADAVHAEITENVVLDAEPALHANLSELGKLGVALQLDDFGTGFASITHLANLPVSGVKIDRAFVARIAGDERISAIVRTLIGLSRSLGLQVIAEGVERVEQQSLLREWGCDALQGYLFGRPVDVDRFERDWLPAPA